VKGRGTRGLLFNSHLDTVPAGPGWTRDPWRAEVVDDRLYGLGSTDAKSCVAAMLEAFVAARDPGDSGRLVFCASSCEETTPDPGENLEAVLDELLPLEAGVIGEPTAFAICPRQRGRVVLALIAEGKAGHASRPWQGVNAIEIAAEDVHTLKEAANCLAHPELLEHGVSAGGGGWTGYPPLPCMPTGPDGEAAFVAGPVPPGGLPPTIQATLIQGGTASNVIPARCEVTLDVRTTIGFDNPSAIAGVQRCVRSRVEVRSDRFQPVATAPDARVVRAAEAALARAGCAATTQDFGGVSDLYHLAARGIDGIILGPGSGEQSHQADEFVSVAAFRRAVAAYAALVEEFFQV
jgi:acetylornithine deacetylase